MMTIAKIIQENQYGEDCGDQNGRVGAKLGGALRKMFEDAAVIEDNPEDDEHAAGNQKNLADEAHVLRRGVPDIAGDQQGQAENSAEFNELLAIQFHQGLPSSFRDHDAGDHALLQRMDSTARMVRNMPRKIQLPKKTRLVVSITPRANGL